MGNIKKQQEIHTNQNKEIPPVIAVLGHVDHGKTSLLDVIRKTNIAQKEHGGITQKIGTSAIEVKSEGKRRKITFIDTPGHEAFALMRKRGVAACDISLLIVSANDGVMPQTKEAIAHILSSKLPFIVVITKSDLPESSPQKVIQQLAKEGVLVDRSGGNIPVIEVSAKTGHHIKELLDLILLVWDMHERESLGDSGFKGIIIESRRDAAVGAVASVIIKNGTIRPRDTIYWKGGSCRIRGLINDQGKQITSAHIGEGVEILGFETCPSVGEIIGFSPPLIENVVQQKTSSVSAEEHAKKSLFGKKQEEQRLAVILCADTEGSLEVIKALLPPAVFFVLAKTGEISKTDILLAKSSAAIIIGFNAVIRNDALHLARIEKVLVKNYAIMHELIKEMQEAIEGKELAMEEQILGVSAVLARFPFEKTFVLGLRVNEGRVAKGDKVRLVRGDETVGESVITSIRQGKDSTSKIEKGKECGIIISPFLDFTIGDMLLCHN
ncbi:MAG: hypothetical protein A3J69_02625 [Candidatus Levybacteria bacterium RIFCSPHIGHO2_02_FULL_42_12]|nr:MAG: hypothetical protein A3J69_02625 [Candidatus Levybacteria bacterium RIFCSPHIGHO2_02_FULL_42_12]OGH43092.1 MAG: hypothetical protein A3B53_03195 [Candidatus Levybacteria bacterium RIFCSPLOWO2_01_FULL_42_15]